MHKLTAHRVRLSLISLMTFLLPLLVLPAAARALTGEVADCAQIRKADVAAILKADPAALTLDSTLPAPGHAQCDFKAVRHVVGGTDATTGELWLDLYHFGNPERAKAQLVSLGRPALLVKTPDKTDDAVALPEQVRTENVNREPGFAVRHQSDLAIAQMTGSFMEERPADWAFRMQALALKTVGATVEGTLFADVCQLVPSGDLQTLLTLDPATITPEDADRGSLRRCRLRAQVDGQAMGNITIKVKHNQTAADLENTESGLERQSLVATNDPADRVLVPAGTRGKATAIHGTTVATIEVEDSDAYAIVSPSFAYRVQRAALQAAGATVLLTNKYGPDPVAKTPPAAVPPSAMNPVSRALNSFDMMSLTWLLPVLIVGGLLLSVFARSRKRSRLLTQGLPGRARIDAVRDTGTTVNNRPLVRFDVTITPDGGMPYQASTTQLVSRLMAPASLVGTTQEVWIDPVNPQSFIFTAGL